MSVGLGSYCRVQGCLHSFGQMAGLRSCSCGATARRGAAGPPLTAFVRRFLSRVAAELGRNSAGSVRYGRTPYNDCCDAVRFGTSQVEVGALVRPVATRACAALIAAVCATVVFSLANAQHGVGSIYVHAAPSVLVFVDGRVVGMTNRQDGGLCIGGVPEGEYEVRLVFDGEIVGEFMPTVMAGGRSDLVLEPPFQGPRWVQHSRQYGSQAIESARVSGVLDGRALVHGLTQERKGDPARHFVAILDERGEFAWRYTVDGDPADNSVLRSVYTSVVPQVPQHRHLVADVAFDGVDGVVLVGTTSGSIAGHIGGSDIYVVKLNANGTEDWARQFGSPEDDFAMAVAVDGSGNVVIAGGTTGSMFSENQGGRDLVVMQLDATGQLMWARQIGTPEDDVPYSLTTDATGQVFVVGRTSGSLAGESLGGYDAFVLAFASSGELVWSQQFGTGGFDGATDVALSADGRIAVVGGTARQLAPREPESMPSDTYVFVRVFGADGSTLWTRQVGYGGVDGTRAVAVHGDEFLVFVGQSEFPLVEGSKSHGGFIRAYTLDGDLLWGREIGTEAADGMTGVVVTDYGRIVTSGFTRGSLFAANDGTLDWFIYVLDEGVFYDGGECR